MYMAEVELVLQVVSAPAAWLFKGIAHGSPPSTSVVDCATSVVARWSNKGDNILCRATVDAMCLASDPSD